MNAVAPSARPVVLLDRDGTLNVEQNYLSDPDQLVLIDGVGAALRRLRALGFGLVVVTNQSGVARGYFDLATVSRIHDRLAALLAAEGVALDDDCSCRKPRPGMVERAAAELGFDPRQAFLVGDSAADIGLGRAVGATPVLVRTGWGRRTEREAACHPAVIVDDLAAAVAWIERTVGSQSDITGKEDRPS
jgi:D-glycero-D-manno-heptose 1,7-bisphosphate phosphatase